MLCVFAVRVCAQIRIYARKSAIDAGQGEYASNITGSILQYFENYYNVAYPLKKSGKWIIKYTVCLIVCNL